MSPSATSPLLIAHLLTLATMMGLVLASAISDVKSYRIPNAFSLGLLALYPLFAMTAPYSVQPLLSLGIMCAVLSVGFGLFAWRKMGGGDVKLITAVSLFAGPSLILETLLVIAVAGGVVSLAMLFRSARFALASAFDHVGARVLRDALLTDAVPYGVAIAAGAVFLALRLADMTVVGAAP